MRCGILNAVMKSIDMVATAAAPEPEAKAKSATAATPDTMIRTIKADFDQSGDLSVLISRHMDQQRWAFNMAVQEALRSPDVTFYDLCRMLTKWRNAKAWLVHDDYARTAGIREACDSRVQRVGLRQGLDAVKKFIESNGKKRRNNALWKHLARRYREKEGVEDVDTAANLPSNKWSNKKNKWSHRGDLFKRKGKMRSLSVFEKPVSKGNGMVMLPGIGTVKVHDDVEGLDMRSFQLVETTKKTTRLTEKHNRTYRLHIQVGMEAPKPETSDVIRGVDMGIVHNATTVDLDTGYAEFHDIPDGSKRTKNDDISKMYAELSRKGGGSGSRRIKARNGGANDGGKNTNGSNRNRSRNPKSRSYKDLQRRIRKKREKIANKQTNWERHASKRIADGAGTVVIEDLNIRNMTARGKGKGSSAKTGLNREMAYSRPRTFLSQIEQTCENMGVAVITVDPSGTSITCHMCGHKDRDSRISQGKFHCTNDKCDNDINADINAAHNIASKATAMAAGRRGSSSKGVRFQAGIASGRSANNTQEPRVGGIARAPQKGRVLRTHVYNSP